MNPSLHFRGVTLRGAIAGLRGECFLTLADPVCFQTRSICRKHVVWSDSFVLFYFGLAILGDVSGISLWF